MADAGATVNAWLKSLRLDAGLSLSQAAGQLGVVKGHMSDLESGRRSPSLPVFVRLCRLYGYDAWSALEWWEEVMPKDVREYLIESARNYLAEGSYTDGDRHEG